MLADITLSFELIAALFTVAYLGKLLITGFPNEQPEWQPVQKRSLLNQHVWQKS